MEALTGIHMDASGVTDEKAYAELLSGMTQGNIPADVLFKASLTREQEQSLLDCGALIDLAPLIEENIPPISPLFCLLIRIGNRSFRLKTGASLPSRCSTQPNSASGLRLAQFEVA